MNFVIKRYADYKNAILLKYYFEDIVRGVRKPNSTLITVAKSIKECKEKPVFKDKSVETIKKYLRTALRGGEFVDKKGKVYIIYPMMDDYTECLNGKKIHQRGFKKIQKITGNVDWEPREEKFVIKYYNKGYGPKKIHDFYAMQKNFNPRTYDAISWFLDEKRRKGLIGRLNIQWNDDIGFVALYLLSKYGKDRYYLARNARTLDSYFYNGEGIVTSSKLNNFYRKSEGAKNIDFSKSESMPYEGHKKTKPQEKIDYDNIPLDDFLEVA